MKKANKKCDGCKHMDKQGNCKMMDKAGGCSCQEPDRDDSIWADGFKPY